MNQSLTTLVFFSSLHSLFQWRHMATEILINIYVGDGLLPDGTKSCWFIREVLWHSRSQRDQDNIRYNVFKNYTLKNTKYLPATNQNTLHFPCFESVYVFSYLFNGWDVPGRWRQLIPYQSGSRVHTGFVTSAKMNSVGINGQVFNWEKIHHYINTPLHSGAAITRPDIACVTNDLSIMRIWENNDRVIMIPHCITNR